MTCAWGILLTDVRPPHPYRGKPAAAVRVRGVGAPAAPLQRCPDRVAARSHRRPRGGPRRGAPRTRALLLRPRAGGGDARPARSGRRERAGPRPAAAVRGHARRSEEHTSELQSLMRISYAVFCLKKKKRTQHNNKKITTQ